MALAVSSAMGSASAQEVLTFNNVWKASQRLVASNGVALAADSGHGEWIIERVDDEFVRLRSRGTGGYLNNEKGLSVGSVDPGWWSAMWALTPAGSSQVQIRNRWTKDALHIETGKLELGKVQPGWSSAKWTTAHAPGSRPKIETYADLPKPRVDSPINHFAYLGTHNAVASYSYSYGLQNSQRYSVTTQLKGGVRVLEIDIIHDQPPVLRSDGSSEPGEAGVYICHCGAAPHSSSQSELDRAKRSDFLSPVPLPGWSHGVVRGRLHEVLKEIDNWLKAHPDEIVFIEPQNNGVTSAQFDAEYALAKMSTKTFVKPLGTPQWPTRRELIKSNQRLIILSSDGDDLGASPQVCPVGYITFKGIVSPDFYGRVKPDAPAPGDELDFLSLGNFRTLPTDAVTARIYNSYVELQERLKDWTEAGYLRPPTFLNVNQVQVGEGLRIVNELNGDAYQVRGEFPVDAAGDWIVNASADTAEWFFQAGTDAGVWVKGANEDIHAAIDEWVRGKQPSPGKRSITFNNQSGYVAWMHLTYVVSEQVAGVTVPMLKAEETDKLAVGFSRSVEIPAGATQIRVSLFGVATVKGSHPIYSGTVSDDFSGEVRFKTWGLFVSPKGGKE